ncbi:MAG: hypothetical protein ACYDAN_06940 [Candidatus Limnocylindrales bacterium]
MSPSVRSAGDDGRAAAGRAELPAPIAEALELLAGETATSRTFLGGVVLGALVGAAVAGASLWRHRAPGRGSNR